MVTDNASNMKSARKLMKIEHIGCFAHMLILIVEDGIKKTNGLETLLKKCRDVVCSSFQKKSTKASDFLREEQLRRNEPVLKLLQDVSTRWNSVLLMIERLLVIGDTIAITLIKLKNAPPHLTYDDTIVLKDVCSILKIFHIATEAISGDRYPTISLMIPLITGLFCKLNDIERSLETDTGKLLIKNLRESLRERCTSYESKNLTKIACLLDPRFKTLAFKNKDNSRDGQVMIQKELAEYFEQNKTDSEVIEEKKNNETDNNENNSAQGLNLFSFIKEKLENTKKGTSSSSKAAQVVF